MASDTRELIALAATRLDAAGVDSPRHDAEELLSWLLGVRRSELIQVDAISAADADRFDSAVARRANREPLQHITGMAAFRHLELRVGPGVFVPRPETELLAGVAIDELRVLTSGGSSTLAVDLCTGSGAVAISMASEVPGVQVVGFELSPDASAYAMENAAGYDVEIRTLDMAELPGSPDAADLLGQVDVVTANPPYIPLEAFESVTAEVRDHDPALALWSGLDGLDAIRVVEWVAAALLKDGGLLACEHADVQGEAAAAIFAASGNWSAVRDHRDLAGRSRFVTARRVPRDDRSAGTISL